MFNNFNRQSREKKDIIFTWVAIRNIWFWFIILHCLYCFFDCNYYFSIKCLVRKWWDFINLSNNEKQKNTSETFSSVSTLTDITKKQSNIYCVFCFVFLFSTLFQCVKKVAVIDRKGFVPFTNETKFVHFMLGLFSTIKTVC